jgi:hypothetical protein
MSPRPVDAHNALAPILLVEIVQATKGNPAEITILLESIAAGALYLIGKTAGDPRLPFAYADALADGIRGRLEQFQRERPI